MYLADKSVLSLWYQLRKKRQERYSAHIDALFDIDALPDIKT